MAQHYKIDCDKVEDRKALVVVLTTNGYTVRMGKETAEKYLKGRDGLAWHISDLKIYDKPRELREFTGLQSTRFGMRPVEITRPPQSWRYVEELSNE